jgi:hypothetical protein
MVSWAARDKVKRLAMADDKAAFHAVSRMLGNPSALRRKAFTFDSLRPLKHHSNFAGKDRASANPVITSGTRKQGSDNNGPFKNARC